MFDPLIVVAIILIYMALLFVVAHRWDGKRGKDLVQKSAWGGVIYALSIGVYCTSWTFYGSVGKAATGGVLFLAIYLGPILVAIFWDSLLTRMIRIKENYRSGSLADFISSRYGCSRWVAGLVTFMALCGIVPYIALQLKALVSSFSLLTEGAKGPFSQNIQSFIGPGVVVAMVVFTVTFGVRRLDTTKRHAGMMAALALECLFKLLAFLAAGIFVTYGLFDGFGDIYEQASAMGVLDRSQAQSPSFLTWCTFTLLAASAIMFLPRQFHVAVVENANPKHVKTARWVFPLYLLAINIFVAPIAMAGQILGHSSALADTFVLRLPLEAGQPILSMAVFLGGFSAATGMVMVSSLALSTMVVNHLFLPLIQLAKPLHALQKYLLQLRWLVVGLFIGAGYLFMVTIGESYMLVNMGMISFASVLQFAPVALGAMFWKAGSRQGAIAGLTAGFMTWLYTLVLPAVVKSGWLPQRIMTEGPFGVEALIPDALFGLSGIDHLSHAVFWSLLLNTTAYIVVSWIYPQSQAQMEFAAGYWGRRAEKQVVDGEAAAQTIALQERITVLEDILNTFIHMHKTRQLIQQALTQVGLDGQAEITVYQLDRLLSVVEKQLAGAIGAAAARQAVSRSQLLSGQEAAALDALYAEAYAQLHLSPHQLRRKVSHHQMKEAVLKQNAAELELTVKERTRQIREANTALEAAMAQAEKANAAKSRFLATMSHELRTPLTAILGYGALVEDPALSRVDVVNHASIINQNAQYLLTLINDILDLSKIESGAMTVESRPMSLVELLAHIQSVAKVQADAKKLYFEIEVATAVPITLRSDTVRLRQILVNLVGNAVKFTLDGGVRLVVEVEDADLPESFIHFHVHDTGIGMDEAATARIFKPFTQADKSTTRRFGGTGLGLSIARSFAQLLGGDITVRSTPGRGSIFTATVSAGDIRQVKKVVALDITAAHSSGTQKQALIPLQGRILIADDSSINRRLARILLEQMGLKCDDAETGLEAHDMAMAAWHAGQPYDVILMDMQMPVLDGWDATRKLRQGGYPLPIMALTANAMAGDEERCLEAGCDAYASKPYNKVKLYRLLGQLIKAARSMGALGDGGLIGREISAS